EVGRATLMATVGSGVARELGMAPATAAETSESLHFGAHEPLVQLMQETPVERLLPELHRRLQEGTSLKSLVAAGALANARTFGGEDYVGFHTLMALSPAYHMARELPTGHAPLAVFKVLYRNTRRIQETGGRKSEVLRPVLPSAEAGGAAELRAAVRTRDTGRAEAMLAGMVQRNARRAFDDLLTTVQQQPEVHRVVLPYRAWDLLDLVGQEHATTLLRQSVRYCLRSEGSRRPSWEEPSALAPRLLEQYRLLDRTPGSRPAEDAWVDNLCQTLFRSAPLAAAEAVAAALAEGFAPEVVGEAISLAANQMVLRDTGRPPQWEDVGKPTGSVHGDSVGVHACDSANAWRNMARIAGLPQKYACLIMGAYQVALDRQNRSADFVNWQPVPAPWQLSQVKGTSADDLLRELDQAIRGNLQSRASAVVVRYAEQGHPARPVFDLLLRYAISEDGALHAEKYYCTASDEFAVTRPAFRWRHVTALARVTASEFGRPAPGYDEARRLLKL
ncbi:MAG: hypothetical protein FJX77_01485, partial [Armatimonadetes bacterium]|nr:hypothetical protein [Armatimonadota bacterium]